MIPMDQYERLAFVDWRNPQHGGAFSCINHNGRHLTWLPSVGIIESCDVNRADLAKLKSEVS